MTTGDKLDKDRFERVTQGIRNRLQDAGLKPARGAGIYEEEGDGWWAKLATWPTSRPEIGIWLNKIPNLGEARHFWFGFYSTNKDKVRSLADDIAPEYPYDTLRDADFFDDDRLRPASAQALKTSDKVIYERYTDREYEDYVGKYEFNLGVADEDELVEEGGRFILEIIECAEPRFLGECEEKKLRREKPTDYLALIKARLGQGQFRTDVGSVWGNACAVTGCKTQQVLRTSHIQPWRDSDNRERLDKNNGLFLSATLDALFDRYLITFDDQGKMRVGPHVPDDDRKILRLEGLALSRAPSQTQQRYLKVHRRIAENKWKAASRSQDNQHDLTLS